MRRLWATTLLLVAGLAAGFATDIGRAQVPTDSEEIQKADFFREGLAPVRKPAAWDVSIVYFFDYQCPACRQHSADVERAFKEEPRVRIIYRDTPIFGPRSDAAARAAIAAQFQGRHDAMHQALMRADLPLDEAAIRAAANRAGVDWERLQRDLKTRRDDIALLIARNFELSLATGIAGTPAFIVGDRLSNGALDYQGLKAEIADARQAANGATRAATATAAPAKATAQVAPAAAAPTEPPASPVFKASASAAESHSPVAVDADAKSGIGKWLWLAGVMAALAALFAALRRRRPHKDAL